MAEPDSSTLNLTILVKEKKAPLSIDAQSTVAQLISSIDTLFPEWRWQRLRLFHAGRVLVTEGVQLKKTLQELGLRNESAVHVHVSEQLRENTPEGVGRPLPPTAVPADASAAAPLQSSQAAAGAAADNSGASSPSSSEQLPPRMGFDRLRILGLDDDQITLLRAEFLPSVREEMMPRMPLEPGETEAHRLLRMEDAWMRAQGPWSAFSANIRPAMMARASSALSIGNDNPELAATMRNMTAEDRRRLASALRAFQGRNGGSASASAADLEAGGAEEWREEARQRQRLGLSPTGAAAASGGGTAPPLPPGLTFYRRPGTTEGDDEDDDDDWRSGSGSAGGASTTSPPGSFSTLIFGVGIGMAFGFIVLLWVGQPSFSRQFRLGLVLGVALNIGWSIALAEKTEKSKQQAGGGGGGGGASTPTGGGGAGGGSGTGTGTGTGTGGGIIGLPTGGTVIDG